MRNPFKPTAGAEPPILIGRDDVVLAFEEGLHNGCGAPGRLMRISGPRGSGKTVLLNDLGERAREFGWKVVDVSAGTGFLADLIHELSSAQHVKSGSLGLTLPPVAGTLSFEKDERSLRDLMRVRAASASGLLVTIDEVQDASVEDMQQVAHAVQHLIREGQDVALVFAGLPMGVAELVNGDALTFLRRALREDLGAIGEEEVSLSLGDSFKASGMTLSSEVLAEITKATAGYPYLIQLVGYYVWQRAANHFSDSSEVTAQDAYEGIRIAMERFHQAVHEPAVAKLSPSALEYLLAMARCGTSTSAGELSAMLGKSTKALSSIRRTLLQRQVIQAPQRGYVEFAIPFLREYLLENQEELGQIV